jgi:hypothetical protein
MADKPLNEHEIKHRENIRLKYQHGFELDGTNVIHVAAMDHKGDRYLWNETGFRIQVARYNEGEKKVIGEILLPADDYYSFTVVAPKYPPFKPAPPPPEH